MMTRTNPTRSRSFFAPAMVVALFLVGRPLTAQANPDSIRLRNDCRLAAQILRTGEPAVKRGWALGFIPSCGDEGRQVLAAYWTARAGSMDTLELAAIARSLDGSVDTRVFQSLLQSVEAPSSSIAARLIAWGLLFDSFDRGAWLPPHELEVTPVDEICSVGYITGPSPSGSSTLPSDYRQQIDAAAQRVIASGQEYSARRFASCVHQFVRYSLARDQ